MNSLFADIFAPATKDQWLQQVQKDLKDANVYESLRWQTPDGFILDPYYTADDLRQVLITDLHKTQKHQPGWLNSPDIQALSDAKATNEQIRDALTRGADSLVINVSTLPVDSLTIAHLLHNVKLSDSPLFFRITHPANFVNLLRQFAPYQLKGGLLTDPIADYLQTGTHLSAEAFASIAEATQQTTDSPAFRTICISSHVFHNAGATATQELAFLLASLVDTYDNLSESGIPTDLLMAKTLLSVSVGTSYFLEIAKLRALRVLIKRLQSAYSASPLAAPLLHVQTSTFYDAAVTPYTNLLRASTEAMAAVIGGCDVLTVHPYDTVFQAPNEFANRIARNISILLKEESHLDKVADPSAGSYYIDIATQQLVDSAWHLFLTVEAKGGLLKAIEQGFVQEQIDAAYKAKIADLEQGKIMVGVNKFRVDEGTSIHLTKPVNLAAILPDRRLAAAFEN